MCLYQELLLLRGTLLVALLVNPLNAELHGWKVYEQP